MDMFATPYGEPAGGGETLQTLLAAAAIRQAEAELNERIRQFNASTGVQREQLAADIRIRQASLDEQKRQFDLQFGEGRRQFDESLRQRGALEAAGLLSSLRGPENAFQYLTAQQALRQGGQPSVMSEIIAALQQRQAEVDATQPIAPSLAPIVAPMPAPITPATTPVTSHGLVGASRPLPSHGPVNPPTRTSGMGNLSLPRSVAPGGRNLSMPDAVPDTRIQPVGPSIQVPQMATQAQPTVSVGMAQVTPRAATTATPARLPLPGTQSAQPRQTVLNPRADISALGQQPAQPPQGNRMTMREWRNLNPYEQQVARSYVEDRGGYWNDYLAQMQRSVPRQSGSRQSVARY